MKISAKLQAILDLPDWKQGRLAGELGVQQSSISRWLNTSVEPRGQNRDAINSLYQRVVAEGGTVERTVLLNGFVGAGQEVYQFDEGGAGYVEAPPGASASTEAVEVKGNSMLPLYEDGTILYYSKQLAPDGMVGKRCVVRLEDQRVLVKSIRRGSERGLYTLVSLNAPDIEDVALQWAAPIDWIKPR
jgi:phage repressor protein C with HTH and peptisase S24 domain